MVHLLFIYPLMTHVHSLVFVIIHAYSLSIYPTMQLLIHLLVFMYSFNYLVTHSEILFTHLLSCLLGSLYCHPCYPSVHSLKLLLIYFFLILVYEQYSITSLINKFNHSSKILIWSFITHLLIHAQFHKLSHSQSNYFLSLIYLSHVPLTYIHSFRHFLNHK